MSEIHHSAAPQPSRHAAFQAGPSRIREAADGWLAAHRPLWAPARIVALAATTLWLRLRSLDSLPPWLWAGEATFGLEARRLLHGQLGALYPGFLRPGWAYACLTAPFVAVWDGQPFAVRVASALLGTLEVPALYFLARALWHDNPQAGQWAGVLAAGAWATSFWAQSIDRIGLPAGIAPLLLTLAAAAWLSWNYRPARGRALFFGALAGLAPLAGPAGIAALFLWPVLFLLLPAAGRRALRGSLPWALLALVVALAPAAAGRLAAPGNATAPASGPSAAAAPALGAPAGGAGLWDTLAAPGQVRTSPEGATFRLEGGLAVLGAFFGFAGDPTPRYNIPGRTPFSLAMTGLFIGGLLAALYGLRRRRSRAALLLLWWLATCVAAAAGGEANPDYARLLPALPAALLLASWPAALAADWMGRHARHLLPRLALFLGILLVVEGVTTGIDYFEAWPKDAGLYTWYQGDVWSAADRALQGSPATAPDTSRPDRPAGMSEPGLTAIVPIEDDLAAGLDYSFDRAPLLHLQASPATIEGWLAANLGPRGGGTVRAVAWDEQPYVSADAARTLPFYLAREGEPEGTETQRGYSIQSYFLGREPDFQAAGQGAGVTAAFAGGLTLTGARWGAAYPNAGRSGTVAAGGTSFWAILSWRSDVQLQDKRAVLDLVDADGHRLASGEAPLLDAAQEREAAWQPQSWRTYHLVEVPATQPAGPVSLEVRVYDAGSLQPLVPASGTPRLSVALAQASTTFAASAGPLPGGMRRLASALSSQVELLGTDPWPGAVAPGGTMTVRAYWELAAPLTSSPSMSAGLGESEARTAGHLSAGTPVGLPQAIQLDLRVPIELEPGSYPLWLAIGGAGGSRVELGQVNVSGRPRLFAAPRLALHSDAGFGGAIRLLGMGSPRELQVSAGQSVTITLVWRALGTTAGDWVRFVHVLGRDGRPVAQADGQPCSGGCPTTSWLPGEVVVDQVRLAIPADLPAGTYPLATGWYDPAAPGMPRLPAEDSAGARLPDDLSLLPARLVVR